MAEQRVAPTAANGQRRGWFCDVVVELLAGFAYLLVGGLLLEETPAGSRGGEPVRRPARRMAAPG